MPSSASFLTLSPPREVYLNAVPIAWQRSDQSIRAKAAGATSSSIVFSTATNSAQSGSTSPISNGDPQSTKGGTTRGAKIAVGICFPVLAIIGAALTVWLLRRRRRADPTAEDRQHYQKAELPADARVGHVQEPKEMDATASPTALAGDGKKISRDRYAELQS